MPGHLSVFRTLTALAVASLAGCYYPYGYGQPGMYYGAPGSGMNPAPGGPTFQPPPGTSFVPPGTYPQPGVQAYNPAPANVIQPQPWQPVTPGTASSPAYNSNGAASTDKLVPEPRDAGDVGNPSSSTPGNSGDLGKPFDMGMKENSGPALYADEQLTAAADATKFQEPIPLKPISSTRSLASASEQQPASPPNPFDFDRQSYRWLRGTVDYDEQDASWHLIYDIEPSDTYGGSITLVDDQRLDGMQPNDVVLVEGRVDTAVRDRLGKPRYRVDNIARLVPKQ